MSRSRNRASPRRARLRRTSFSLSPSGRSCCSTSSRMRSVSSFREPQARQQRGRKRAALLRVASEVTDPLLVYGLAGRFSAVVQQHRPPQTGIRRNLPDRANGMPPDVVTVMRIILCAAEHRHELRQRRADDVVVFQQRALRPTAAQQPRQLLAHAHLLQRRKGGRAAAASPQQVFSSIAKPSSDAKRTPRRMRSASSVKRVSGSPTARRMRFFRSF